MQSFFEDPKFCGPCAIVPSQAFCESKIFLLGMSWFQNHFCRFFRGLLEGVYLGSRVLLLGSKFLFWGILWLKYLGSTLDL